MDLDWILKPEELIDRLEYAEKQCVKGYYFILIRPDTRDRIVELLKEKKAVKPILTPWIENDVTTVYGMRCGKCGTPFYYEDQKYCSECGTPILWEGQ